MARVSVAKKPTPKEGVKAAKAEMYRRLIVEAAEPVFAEHGFDEAKMQDIAQGAGIALGTLYSVFPGKSELYAAIQEQRGREMLEGIYNAIQGYTGVADACQRGIEAYVRVLVERPHFLRMHLRDGLSWTDPSSLRSGVEVATWERGMSLAVDLLRMGIERGFLLPNRPELVLKMMVATHQVQLTDWLERGAKANEVDALIADMQRHFVRAFVNAANDQKLASG
ncbi:MAG: TetR/AcrR family transcriptional regulator [Polyangiales bacterium]